MPSSSSRFELEQGGGVQRFDLLLLSDIPTSYGKSRSSITTYPADGSLWNVAEHDNHNAALWAKFDKDVSTEILVMDKQCFGRFQIESSKPNDAFMRQKTRPSLVKIMSWCLLSSEPLSKTVMTNLNWTLGNKFQWNLNRNRTILVQENTHEPAICKTEAFIRRSHILSYDLTTSRCRGARLILKWYANLNCQSRGFETSRNLT